MIREIAFSGIVLLVAGTAGGQLRERCSACLKFIAQDGITAEGRCFHRSCFTCADCGRIISRSYINENSKFYHPACHEKHRSTCVVCGNPVSKYYREDYWGTTYCSEHYDDVAHCDFCDRPILGPILGKELLLEDGRRLCGICAPSAVRSGSAAKSLLVEIADRLRSFGIDAKHEEISILLLNREQLRRLSRGSDRDFQGYTDYAFVGGAGGKPKVEAFNLYLLSGMPEPQMRSVIAHELMHVWQFQHGIPPTDEAICEGSCNYASYLIMEDLGTVEAKYVVRRMMEDPDPIYGAGFRDVKRFVDTRGIEAWLQMIDDVPPAGGRVSR